MRAKRAMCVCVRGMYEEMFKTRRRIEIATGCFRLGSNPKSTGKPPQLTFPKHWIQKSTREHTIELKEGSRGESGAGIGVEAEEEDFS